ncbi:hypothetical protein LPY66_18175 [Dehalobacter sp. DCM]|uniref:phage tail tube protein n=1 Tax=Dehalobacter sp. DCM TaxID=2907827 RepID=UPI00308124CE|nr:hypothetical protein LPY66_18175 [Dehalobacter sp. DCM]
MAKRGLGTTISINSVMIGGLTNIKPPEKSADTIECTTLDSSSGYRDFIQGFKDGGEVELTGYYDTTYTGQSNIDTAYESGTTDTYIITFPNSMGTFTFSGIVTKLAGPGEANINDPLGFNATIKVLGKPVLGTTASGGLTALVLTGTGGTLTPTFGAALRSYYFGGVSATSVTVTPTAASHTIKLFVDGVYSQDITSGQASTAISLTLNAPKKLTLICYEAAKTPIVYDIIVNKAS